MHDIRPYLPELFTNPGSLLYIGARADAHSWLEELHEVGNSITILEVWPDNIASLMEIGHMFGIVIINDVRNVDEAFKIWNFDYTFWWHGPEHLTAAEIKTTLTALEAKTRRTIALACPWGIYPQGVHEGNPYEVHRTTLYPEFFTELGYEVATDGEADKLGSEIVAWKRKGSGEFGRLGEATFEGLVKWEGKAWKGLS